MNLSDLISNEQYNPSGFPVRQYIQLGSGLSMQVTGYEVKPDGWVNLKVQRFNRLRGELDTAELLVTQRGDFLPNGNRCTNDVVCVSREDGTSHLTLKGEEHTITTVDLNTALHHQKTLMRVKTRGGYWYTVRDALEDKSRGVFMLQLSQIGTECKTKMKHYYNNGLEFSDAPYNKRFNLNDIVEVQIS